MTLFRYQGRPIEVSCLQCAYAQIGKPPEPSWRQKACADHYQMRHCDWDAQHAKEYVQATRAILNIGCTLYPIWQQFRHDHYCGQFEPREHKEVPSLEEYLHGEWATRYYRESTKQIATLRKQLASARQRSAQRLERLQKLEAPKPKAKPRTKAIEEPVPAPTTEIPAAAAPEAAFDDIVDRLLPRVM